MELNFIPVKTRIVRPPKDEIWDILDGLELVDGDIVFITSKILGIHQGRCVPVGEIGKVELIKREATHYLPYKHPSGLDINLTITDNILIPAAGIDESNADGHYVMWPTNADKLCAEIRKRLTKKNEIKDLGVVATDSHTTPLRWGVTGITIGLAGVEPLRDERGHKDLFSRPLHITQVNQIDPLTAMAVLLMGEAAEQTPIVILRGYTGIKFNARANMDGFNIPPEQDLYTPMLATLTKTQN